MSVEMNERNAPNTIVREIAHEEVGLKTTFIRLVGPGEVDTDSIESWSVNVSNIDLTVDLDGSGNIIGVTIAEFSH